MLNNHRSKASLIKEIENQLVAQSYEDVRSKISEPSGEKFPTPNVIAFRGNEMCMVDVKTQAPTDGSRVLKKWAGLRNIANRVGAVFYVALPEDEISRAREVLRRNRLGVKLVGISKH